MQVIRALKSPVHSMRKVREYGVGRVVLDQLKDYPTLQWHVREPVRMAKIGVDAAGYIKRRRLAAEITRNSPYKDFFPTDTAFRAVPPGTFDAVDNIIPIARRIYRRFLETYPSGRLDKTSYSYLLFDMDKPYGGTRHTDLRAHPEFVELACYRPFVELASGYLGEVPVLGMLDFQVVMPNEHTTGFQQFHIDRIARRQVKIFIAVEDVDEGNGATVLIAANESERIAAELGHRFGRIADERLMSDEWRHLITHASGPAGTAFLFDPCRVIHCGARARTRPRQFIMLQYVSKYSYAEPPSERGAISFDRAQIVGDQIKELIFNLF